MSFNLNIDASKTVHFLGIGGISMSAIALLLNDHGFTVTGSDDFESPVVEKLRSKGVKVNVPLKKENISEDSIVVYTHAIKPDNEEFKRALDLNLEIFSRAEFLGFIMKNYKYSIGISGTHGKTSTTSMLSHILIEGETDPTLFVGGNLDLIGGNLRIGKSEYFLTEACEYKESFLNFYPSVGVILNIDEDHLDYYRDIDHIEEAFVKYGQSIPSHGHLIINQDDSRSKSVIDACSCNVLTFGLNSGDVYAKNLEYSPDGFGIFDLIYKENNLGKVRLNTPGEHNVYNALAAICTALAVSISFDDIKKGIESFTGTHRRFETLGEINGCKVIAEYAHHPTEIITATKTGKSITKGKLYCVFQPHTYTRTHALLNDFAKSFDLADEIVFCDIYAAREKDTGIVSSEILCNETSKHNSSCKYIGSLEDVADHIHPKLSPNDTLMIIGAGDVIKIWDLLEKK